MTEDIKIFVLEDSSSDRELIEETLIERGLHPHFLYSHSSELLPMLKGNPSVLAMDFYLSGENLIDSNIIRKVKDACEECYVIVMSGQDAKTNFIQLLKANANDYVEKTGSASWLDELAVAIEEGRSVVQKRIEAIKERKQKEEERQQIQQELEDVRRRLNERIKKRNGTA